MSIPLAVLEGITDAPGTAPRIEVLLPIGVRHRQLRVRTLILGMLLTLASRRPAFLTEVHAALIALPEAVQARLGVIEDWEYGSHQLTYRQVERTFSLVMTALSKDEPDGAPSGVLGGVLDDLLEASIPAEHKDASTALAADWTDVETFARPPRRGSTGCADPEASWGHRNSNLPGPKGEMFFGYYLSAGTMTREEKGPAVPELARRMTLTSCELDPVRALAPVLTRMPGAGIPLGDILDDSGYAHRDADAWAIPLRQAGAQLIQDLHPHDLFRTNFCPFCLFSNDLMEWRNRRSPGIADGRHSQVGGSGAAVAFDASVEAGEFAFSGLQADLEALDFAEPAVAFGFGDAGGQVVARSRRGGAAGRGPAGASGIAGPIN